MFSTRNYAQATVKPLPEFAVLERPYMINSNSIAIEPDYTKQQIQPMHSLNLNSHLDKSSILRKHLSVDIGTASLTEARPSIDIN